MGGGGAGGGALDRVTWLNILGVIQGARSGRLAVADTTGVISVAVESELMISVDSFLGGGGGLMIRVAPCSCFTGSRAGGADMVLTQGCRNMVGVREEFRLLVLPELIRIWSAFPELNKI